FDYDGADHATRHLNIGRAVEMRMVPVGAARVVRGQRDLDVVALARLHQPHDVVGVPLGLQCAPWKCRFVLLNWCGYEVMVGGRSRLGGRSLMSRIFRLSPGFMRSVGASPPS